MTEEPVADGQGWERLVDISAAGRFPDRGDRRSPVLGTFPRSWADVEDLHAGDDLLMASRAA